MNADNSIIQQTVYLAAENNDWCYVYLNYNDMHNMHDISSI